MAARIINGTLFVSNYTSTVNPGEWTFTGATYSNVADATGNGAFDITTGFILYVPANDINTALPVTGVCHRYKLTAVTASNSNTIDGTMLWDEGGAEIDQPNNGDTAIISERGTGLGLGFPPSSQVYSSLSSGIDYCAYAVDARSIIDKITANTKEITETRAALLTVSDGDFAFDHTMGLTHDPNGWVIVTLNGNEVIVGDGTSSNCDCYFTPPGATTPIRTADAITTGDALRWVGSYAGYQLATTDVLFLNYEYNP